MKHVSERNFTRSDALVAVCCLVTVASLLAADWPTFRNTSNNAGASSETINLPLTEVWHSTAPAVEENGVVVASGIAYMMSQSGELHAFTVSSGFEVAGFPVLASQTYGTPAVDTANGRIYVIAGSQLWAFKLDGTSAFPPINVGTMGTNYSQGPIIDGGFVYFQAGGLLQKYNSSGAAQWTSASSGDNTQPAISGNFVYKNTEAGQIRKFDKATGAEVLDCHDCLSSLAGRREWKDLSQERRAPCLRCHYRHGTLESAHRRKFHVLQLPRSG